MQPPVKIGGPVLKSALLLDFWFIGAMGLAGMILMMRSCKRKPSRMMLPVFILIYCFSIVLFYMLGRFRLPVFPLLAISAAYIANMIYLMFKKRESKHFAAKIITIFLCFIFVFYFYDLYRSSIEPSVMTVARPDGVQLQLADRFKVADNGPQTFGGWSTLTYYTQKTTHQVEKTFVITSDPQRIKGGRIKISAGRMINL